MRAFPGFRVGVFSSTSGRVGMILKDLARSLEAEIKSREGQAPQTPSSPRTGLQTGQG